MMMNHMNTVLYTGVTSDLVSRVQEHKSKKHFRSFTAKYNCSKLVYYEVFSSIEEAILREKEIKGWKRFKKDILIDSLNASRRDLFQQISDW